MSERYPGGIISKTPPTVTGPATSGPLAGEGGSASGVWTLADVLTNRKIGIWPVPPVPRKLWAWGYNFYGSVGDNTIANKSSPVQVGSLETWYQVSTGCFLYGITTAIKTDGTLWAWGYNSQGQLGNSTVISRSSPVQVGALTNWSTVDSGGTHVVSRKNDGTIWTWGYNSYGSVGDNTIINKSSPVQVGALTTWALVSAGSDYTAAIKTDGTLWSWGDNSGGQLGSNTVIPRSSPVQVGALTTWSQISAGFSHTAAIKTDGTLWFWGRNNSGQLGDGTIIHRSSPVQVGALTTWSQVSAGAYVHSTALKTDGTLWAWGNNSFGQLGQNSSTSRSSPVQVGALTTWLQVSNGSRFSTALKTDGTLWTWGYNPNGQLGQNNFTSCSSPVQVGGLTKWSQVSAGDNYAVAIYKG